MAQAAAPSVKKVALELGGKNPNVVFADACATEEGFDTAVDQALNAAFIHSGQVCSAGARLIIEESVRDRFVAELARRADRIRLGRGTEDGVECGPLVSEQQRAKVEAYVESALEEGAVLRCGGKRPEPSAERPANGYFYEPTVLDHCHREMRVVREEVFGPVLTVETFRTEDEAVALANDTEYGLAGAVWTADAGRARRVAGRLRHGTVWINDFHPYLPQAEWGGFGKSGWAANSAPPDWRSTARRSTSTRTSPRSPSAGSAADPVFRWFGRWAHPSAAPVRSRAQATPSPGQALAPQAPGVPLMPENPHVYDYVVIGGGTAGSVIASRLTENPDVTVAVIEGGPSDVDRDDVLTLRRWMGLLGGELDYDYPTTEQPRGNSHIRHSRARVLGGCSSHNTLIAFKPLPSDWDEWEAAGAKGWGAVQMEAYYARLQQQHRPGRREGPQRHRPRLRRLRAEGAGGAPRRGLQQDAVQRGRRLLRPRLPPREQQAVQCLGGVPPPGDGRAAQPPHHAGDLGVPAGAGRHPRQGRARPHEGRRGDPRTGRQGGAALRGRRRLARGCCCTPASARRRTSSSWAFPSCTTCRASARTSSTTPSR